MKITFFLVKLFNTRILVPMTTERLKCTSFHPKSGCISLKGKTLYKVKSRFLKVIKDGLYFSGTVNTLMTVHFRKGMILLWDVSHWTKVRGSKNKLLFKKQTCVSSHSGVLCWRTNTHYLPSLHPPTCKVQTSSLRAGQKLTMSMNILTCYVQVEDSIVRSQAVFHQHSHSEYAHILVGVFDPIFCWAEIGIWNSSAVAKIHLNEGSLEVSLWWQKKQRVRIDFFLFFFSEWDFLEDQSTASDVSRSPGGSYSKRLRETESVEWCRPSSA